MPSPHSQKSLDGRRSYRIPASATIEIDLVLEAGTNQISGVGVAQADLDYFLYDARKQLILEDSDLTSQLNAKRVSKEDEVLTLVVKSNSDHQATLDVEIERA